MTHTVSGGGYDGVGADAVTVYVIDEDLARSKHMADEWLVRFGRTVAGGMVDLVGDRFENMAEEGSQVSFGGRTTLRLGEERSLSGPPSIDASQGNGPEQTCPNHANSETGPIGAGGWSWTACPGGTERVAMSAEEFLLGSSFQIALGEGTEGGAGGLRLWGKATTAGFDGRTRNGTSLDGSVHSGHLGIETIAPDILVGLAVSHSRGDGGFGGDLVGDVRATLTSAYPYMRWSPTDRLAVWGLAGYGNGKFEESRASDALETDIDMRVAALGASHALARMGDVELALKADAFAMNMDAYSDPSVQRVRLALDGRTDWMLSQGSHMSPFLKLRTRYDDGDAETGAGLEIETGLTWLDPRLGLEVNGYGHWLLVHEDSDFEEWGAGLMVRVHPGPDRKGLSFLFQPALERTSSDADVLWRHDAAHVLESRSGLRDTTPRPRTSQRVSMEIGYGLGLAGGTTMLTPFAEANLQNAGSHYNRLGLRLNAPGPGNGLRATLFGAHYAHKDTEAEWRIGLTTSLNF